MSGHTYHIFISYTHNGGPRKEKYHKFDRVLVFFKISENSRARKWCNHSADYYTACDLEKKIQGYKFPKDKKLLEKYPHISNIKTIKVFRDENELGFGELTEELKDTIANSIQQVVIASPYSRQKPWINKEVEYFRETHADINKSIPFTIDGIPYAKQRRLPSEEECLPDYFLKEFEEKCQDMTLEEKDNYVRIFPDKRSDGTNKSAVKIIANAFDIKPFDDLWKAECRRKNRRIIGQVLVFLFICLSFLLFYSRYFMVHTEYYVKTVDRYGIPVGLHELKKEETDKYISYVKIERKNRKIISAANYSSLGKLGTEFLSQGIREFTDSYNTIRRFSYNNNTGELESVSYYNSKNECLRRLVYHSDSLAEIRYPSQNGGYALNIVNSERNSTNYNTFVYRLNERGEINELFLLHNSKDIEITKDTPAIKYERDNYGRIVKVTVLNDAMSSLLEHNNVVTCIAEYNNNGCQRFATYGLNGEAKINEDWSYVTEIRGQGSYCIEFLYTDTLGNLCNTINGIAKSVSVINSYPKYKECITTYYGTDNQPVCDNSNVCIKEFKVYNNGKEITRFYDKAKKPVLHKENMHMMVYEEYNDSIVQSYYDVNGKLINNPALGYAVKVTYWKNNMFITEYYNQYRQPCGNIENGIAKKESVYNSLNQIIEERHYNSSGQLWSGYLDAKVIEYKYDKQGNLAEVRYTDGYGNLVNAIGQNHAIVRQKYDDRGFCSMISFYDVKGKRCMGPEGFSYMYNVYNNKGLLIRQTKYNEKEETLFPAVIERTYNEKGNINSIIYKDSNAVPIIGDDGFSQAQIKYSDTSADNALSITTSCYGTDGNKINNRYGVHYEEIIKDIDGNILSCLYRDTNGLPVKSGNGSKYLYEYDERGFCTKEVCIDETVIPSFSESIMRKYNSFGDLEEEVNYCGNTFVSKTKYHKNYLEYYSEQWNLDENDSLINNSSEIAIERIEYTLNYEIKQIAYYNNKRNLSFNKEFQFAYCNVDYENHLVNYYDEDSLLIRVEYDKGEKNGIIQRSPNRYEIERLNKYTEMITFYQNDTVSQNFMGDGCAIIVKKKDYLGRIIESTGYNEKYNQCNNINGIHSTKIKYIENSNFIESIEYRDSLGLPAENIFQRGFRYFKRRTIRFLQHDNMSYEAMLNKNGDLISTGWYSNQQQRVLMGIASYHIIYYDNRKRIDKVIYYDAEEEKIMLNNYISESKYVYEDDSMLPTRIEHYNGYGMFLGTVVIQMKDDCYLYLEGRDSYGNPCPVDGDYREIDMDTEEYNCNQIQLLVEEDKVIEKVLSKEGRWLIPNQQSLLQYQLCRQIFKLPPLF